MCKLIEKCESDKTWDHDKDPLQFELKHTGGTVDTGSFSRKRKLLDTTASVLGWLTAASCYIICNICMMYTYSPNGAMARWKIHVHIYVPHIWSFICMCSTHIYEYIHVCHVWKYGIRETVMYLRCTSTVIIIKEFNCLFINYNIYLFTYIYGYIIYGYI